MQFTKKIEIEIVLMYFLFNKMQLCTEKVKTIVLNIIGLIIIFTPVICLICIAFRGSELVMINNDLNITYDCIADDYSLTNKELIMTGKITSINKNFVVIYKTWNVNEAINIQESVKKNEGEFECYITFDYEYNEIYKGYLVHIRRDLLHMRTIRIVHIILLAIPVVLSLGLIIYTVRIYRNFIHYEIIKN